MSYTKTQGKTLNLNEKYFSIGSELIPAEVQTPIHPNEAESVDTPFVVGYTIDDEGLINNFSVEPDVYPSEYPSPQKQRYYRILGATAILFVVGLMLVALSVS